MVMMMTMVVIDYNDDNGSKVGGYHYENNIHLRNKNTTKPTEILHSGHLVVQNNNVSPQGNEISSPSEIFQCS